MQKKIIDLLEKNTAPEIMDSFSKTLDVLGARYFSILGGEKDKSLNSLTTFYSSCPKEWLEHYHSGSFFEKDPLLQAFLDPSQSMYFWEASDPKSQFMNRCRDFDINYRLGFFIRNPTWHYAVVFSFKDSCEEIVTSPSQRHLFEILSSIIASNIHAKATTVVSLSLTTRELECLRWSSEGKTAEEIGIILSISHWTVTFHLQNTYKKLGVYNKTAAILKAIKLRLL